MLDLQYLTWLVVAIVYSIVKQILWWSVRWNEAMGISIILIFVVKLEIFWRHLHEINYKQSVTFITITLIYCYFREVDAQRLNSTYNPSFQYYFRSLFFNRFSIECRKAKPKWTRKRKRRENVVEKPAIGLSFAYIAWVFRPITNWSKTKLKQY